jgi:hypothetical protein
LTARPPADKPRSAVASAKTVVFFRDDDVGELSPELSAFVELLLEEEVPCNYQVVPAHLSGEAAAYMKAKRRRDPELIELDQHGYRHEHQVDGRRTYEEFGGGRSFDDQLQAIARGRAMLVEQLGDDFSGEVFTPPCHKYDARTLDVLRVLGFGVISAGVRTDRKALAYYRVGRALGRIGLLGKRVSYHMEKTPHGVVELSCAVDVDPEIADRPKKTLKTLQEELTDARSKQPIVGVMFHHQTYSSPEKLELLRSFARWLRSDPSIELSTIGRIEAMRR